MMQMKLMFAYHLHQLPETSLCNQILKGMEKLKLSSLHKEVKNFMADLGLKEMSEYTKKERKQEIDTKFEDKHYQNLMTNIKTYKKLDYEELSKGWQG